jgi:broad specificity phosphatase PhoE
MKESDEALSPKSRETMQQLRDRIKSFLEALVQRPKTNIVVVSHGVFMETLFHVFCPEALDHGRRRSYNCNVFVLFVVRNASVVVKIGNPLLSSMP